MSIQRVCVYCASSSACDAVYLNAARDLGTALAREGLEVVYGGGAVGLMGALAEGALAAGGRVTGIIPEFMIEREWGHSGITDLQIADDMHHRKHLMMQRADAFVALPGGSGTFEELFEVLTWKRLGLHHAPVLIANINGYFDPCLELLERSVTERFMRTEDASLWLTARTVEGILPALRAAAAG